MALQWENYSAAATFVVKPAKGLLHRIVINTTAGGAITVYDNASAASGKKIATIKSNITEQTLNYGGEEGLPFVNGLTIVLAAASDITVAFS